MIPDPRVTDALRQYEQGRTTRDIAADLGVDHRTVGRWAVAAGVSRPRGRRPREDIADSRILSLFDAGIGPRAIGRAVGMSHNGVRKRLAKLLEARRPYVDREIVELWDRGIYSWRAIAKHLGASDEAELRRRYIRATVPEGEWPNWVR